ncbi:MAG: hypothetical protein H6734_23865 [Alphaproteobacteria bacterium]|nr:hypothetical protein [Alphaproteobacteria bacterium]
MRLRRLVPVVLITLVPALAGIDCDGNPDPPGRRTPANVWEVAFVDTEGVQRLPPGGSHDLRAVPMGDAPETYRFCYDTPNVLLAPACFDTDGLGDPLTATVVLVDDAPVGQHQLRLTESDLPGDILVPESIQFEVVAPDPPPTVVPVGIEATPGLYASGNVFVVVGLGDPLDAPVVFDVTGIGVTVPATVEAPEGATSLELDVQPFGEGYVSVQISGDQRTFVLDDLRLNGRNEPVLGEYFGTGTAFNTFVPLAADLTYTREETSGLYGASSQLRVQGTFHYGDPILDIDAYIGEQGEDTIVIPYGTDRLLLTHAYGAPGSITFSFNRVDADNLNVDASSFEIVSQ